MTGSALGERAPARDGNPASGRTSSMATTRGDRRGPHHRPDVRLCRIARVADRILMDGSEYSLQVDGRPRIRLKPSDSCSYALTESAERRLRAVVGWAGDAS